MASIEIQGSLHKSTDPHRDLDGYFIPVTWRAEYQGIQDPRTIHAPGVTIPFNHVVWSDDELDGEGRVLSIERFKSFMSRATRLDIPKSIQIWHHARHIKYGVPAESFYAFDTFMKAHPEDRVRVSYRTHDASLEDGVWMHNGTRDPMLIPQFKEPNLSPDRKEQIVEIVPSLVRMERPVKPWLHDGAQTQR